MDTLLQAAEKQASNQTSCQNLEFDEKFFQQFMSKNLLWESLYDTRGISSKK